LTLNENKLTFVFALLFADPVIVSYYRPQVGARKKRKGRREAGEGRKGVEGDPNFLTKRRPSCIPH
jgi:hypothetical protein